MQEEQRIINRKTTWHVINIKARTNQTPMHYVDAFREINTQDPLIEMERTRERYVSIRSMCECTIMTTEGCPRWIELNLVAYTMIDANAFYNRRSKEDVQMSWNEDVVANKKEAQLIFVPAVHKVVVKRNSEISLNYILQYLFGALESVEPDTFDVDTVKDRDTLDRIMTAEKLLSLTAHVSFSNPGRGDDFLALLDAKTRESNTSSLEITLQGSENNPLQRAEDGLVNALINMSEENGSVQAVIQNGSAIGREVIDSKDHPLIFQVPQIIGDIVSTMYNAVMAHFNNQ